MDRRFWSLVAAASLTVEAVEAQQSDALLLDDTIGVQMALAGQLTGVRDDQALGHDAYAHPGSLVGGGYHPLVFPIYRFPRPEVPESRPSGPALGAWITPMTGATAGGIIGRVPRMLAGSEHAVLASVTQAVLGAAGGYLLGSTVGPSANPRSSAVKATANPRTVTLKFKIRF